jgi:membrane fusion protein (multidrug efflux system)
MRTFGIETIAIISLIASTAALTSGCGSGDARANTTASPAGAGATVIPVAVATAIKRDVPVVVRATGTFTPDESSDVAAQVSGQVLKPLVNVGDMVKAGQPLVLLDDRDARLRLDEARASLERAEADAQQAKSDARRSGELFQRGFTPRSDFERLAAQDTGAHAAVAQARAQVASAQKAVDDTIVRAPFPGHVTARPVAAGEYVMPASKIATVVRIQPIKLDMSVKEADAVKMGRGMVVQAEVSGYPGVLFAGAVSALNVAIDPNSRAMMVEATFPNPDGRMTPGMFGTVQIRLSATETGVFAPTDAVLKVADAAAVYVIAGGRAQLRVVQLGEQRNGMTRVASGLDEGAVVATNNLDKLFDGASVRMTKASDASDAAAQTGRSR